MEALDKGRTQFVNSRTDRRGVKIGKGYVALDDVDFTTSGIYDNYPFPFYEGYGRELNSLSSKSLPEAVSEYGHKGSTKVQLVWDGICLGQSEDEVSNLSKERIIAMDRSCSLHSHRSRSGSFNIPPHETAMETDEVKLLRELRRRYRNSGEVNFMPQKKHTNRVSSPIKWVASNTFKWWLMERENVGIGRSSPSSDDSEDGDGEMNQRQDRESGKHNVNNEQSSEIRGKSSSKRQFDSVREQRNQRKQQKRAGRELQRRGHSEGIREGQGSGSKGRRKESLIELASTKVKPSSTALSQDQPPPSSAALSRDHSVGHRQSPLTKSYTSHAQVDQNQRRMPQATKTISHAEHNRRPVPQAIKTTSQAAVARNQHRETERSKNSSRAEVESNQRVESETKTLSQVEVERNQLSEPHPSKPVSQAEVERNQRSERQPLKDDGERGIRSSQEVSRTVERKQRIDPQPLKSSSEVVRNQLVEAQTLKTVSKRVEAEVGRNHHSESQSLKAAGERGQLTESQTKASSQEAKTSLPAVVDRNQHNEPHPSKYASQSAIDRNHRSVPHLSKPAIPAAVGRNQSHTPASHVEALRIESGSDKDDSPGPASTTEAASNWTGNQQQSPSGNRGDKPSRVEGKSKTENRRRLWVRKERTSDRRDCDIDHEGSKKQLSRHLPNKQRRQLQLSMETEEVSAGIKGALPRRSSTSDRENHQHYSRRQSGENHDSSSDSSSPSESENHHEVSCPEADADLERGVYEEEEDAPDVDADAGNSSHVEEGQEDDQQTRREDTERVIEASEEEVRPIRGQKRFAKSLPTTSRLSKRRQTQGVHEDEIDNVLINHIDRQYVENPVYITMDFLKKPSTEKDFDQSHLELVRGLMMNGYKPTRGMIVTYASPKDVGTDLNRNSMTDLRDLHHLRGKLEVVDGKCRTIVLKETLDSSRKITAILLQRRDGKEISDAELDLYAARRNGTSSSQKIQTFSNLVKVATTAMELLTKEYEDASKHTIYWFQCHICEMLGYHRSKRPALRNITKIARQRQGRQLLTVMMDKILQATPKIGASHLNIQEDMLEDIYIFELYLLSLRKAFFPTLRGPQGKNDSSSRWIGDSEFMRNTRGMKAVKIRQMKLFQEEMFKDLKNVVNGLSIAEDDNLLTIGDILLKSGRRTDTIRVRVEGGKNGSEEFTLSYRLRDSITDTLCLWFTDREHDRVAELLQSVKTFLQTSGTNIFGETSADFDKNIDVLRQSFTPFILSKSKKSGEGKKSKEGQAESASEYNSVDLESSRKSMGDGTVQNTPQEASSHSFPSNNAGKEKDTTPEVDQSSSSNQHAPEASVLNQPSAKSSPVNSRTTMETSGNQFLYDDDIPETRPVGSLTVSDAEVQNAVIPAAAVMDNEEEKISVPSGLWKVRRTSTVPMEKWIESLFLKKGHRAAMFLTHPILKRMHDSLHSRLSTSYSDVERSFAHLIQPAYDTSAIDNVFSLLHIRKMKMDLRSAGWTVLSACRFLEDPMRSLGSFFREQPHTVNEQAVWELIANTLDESENISDLAEKGCGRKMTSKFAMTDLLEQSKGMEWKKRAEVDVYIGLLARALELGALSDGQWDLFMPATGGRELATDPGTEDQSLHQDTTKLPNPVRGIITQPGYFAMVSGEFGFFIWIAERSHINHHKKWTSKNHSGQEDLCQAIQHFDCEGGRVSCWCFV